MEELKSAFMVELTNKDIENYLKRNNMVIIPVGSCEQHGDHLPLGTDVFIPNEIARRISKKMDALIAPPLYYTLSQGHKGASGLAYISARTLLSLAEDIGNSFLEVGFRRIFFLNGHWTNIGILTMACSEVSKNAPEDTQIYACTYWDTLPEDQLNDYLSLKVGLHANIGETSAVLAINSSLVDLNEAKEFWPKMPSFHGSPIAVLNAYFDAQEGSSWKTYKGGIFGNPKESSIEKGKKFLDQIEIAVLSFINEIEEMNRTLKIK